MEVFIEILKFILPAVLVIVTAFYILKKFFENEEKKRYAETRKENTSSILPIRLQAYERLILFLERISLDNLILRTHKKNTKTKDFQANLIQTIRSEYEHNMAQQIYISNAGWDLVKRSKEETIKIINIAATRVNENDTSLELSKAIFNVTTELGKLPTQIAIDYLKKEIRQSF